ncbi:MAG: hypothetical protein ACREE7_12190, partial [Dongiaceae bacterium]
MATALQLALVIPPSPAAAEASLVFRSSTNAAQDTGELNAVVSLLQGVTQLLSFESQIAADGFGVFDSNVGFGYSRIVGDGWRLGGRGRINHRLDNGIVVQRVRLDVDAANDVWRLHAAGDIEYDSAGRAGAVDTARLEVGRRQFSWATNLNNADTGRDTGAEAGWRVPLALPRVALGVWA